MTTLLTIINVMNTSNDNLANLDEYANKYEVTKNFKVK